MRRYYVGRAGKRQTDRSPLPYGVEVARVRCAGGSPCPIHPHKRRCKGVCIQGGGNGYDGPHAPYLVRPGFVLTGGRVGAGGPSNALVVDAAGRYHVIPCRTVRRKRPEHALEGRDAVDHRRKWRG